MGRTQFGHMKRIVAEPSWGAMIIHDTDNDELSLQCTCGGIAMYYQRVVLTLEESADFKAGALDVDTLIYEVCKDIPRVADRLAPILAVKDLVNSPQGSPDPKQTQAMEMKKLFTGNEGYCDVFEDDKGTLYLVAACSGIAWWRARIVMSDEEATAFRLDPTSVESIENQMYRDIGPFESRDIPEALRDEF